MRNPNVRYDTDVNTRTCDCCGGEFYSDDVIGVYQAVVDNPSARLGLCDDCIDDLPKELQDEVQHSDTVPAEQWPALVEHCKLHRILAFIPAEEQINELEDVEDFFDALSTFLNWHPDTRFEDYEHVKTGAKVFTDRDDAKALDACMTRCGVVCDRVTKQTADVYDMAMKSAQKHGHAPTDAEYEKAVKDDLTDWKYEVANGDTLLGYADWCRHKKQ